MINDAAIGHFYGPITGFCKIIVLGHCYDALAEFYGQLFENVQYDLTILAVKISDKFVPHDDRRIIDKSSGNKNPLLLAAEFGGLLKRLILKAQHFHLFISPCLHFFIAVFFSLRAGIITYLRQVYSGSR